MVDTLGLLAEAIQLANELGYDVREEPLGDTASGEVRIGAARHILLNVSDLPADQLRAAYENSWQLTIVGKLCR